MNELLDDNWGEEVVIEYIKADVGIRFFAFLIDSFIFSVLVYVNILILFFAV